MLPGGSAPTASGRTRCTTPSCTASKAEVEQWKQRDPIAAFARGVCTTWGLLGDADLAGLEAAVAAEVEEAVRFAEAGPWEPVEDLSQRDVYHAGRRAQ